MQPTGQPLRLEPLSAGRTVPLRLVTGRTESCDEVPVDLRWKELHHSSPRRAATGFSMAAELPDWLSDIQRHAPGYEKEVVDRYTDRLLRLAGRRLPASIQARLDAEDILQSVFRSFFGRHEADEFHFDETDDVWRLLATMTFRKVLQKLKHHGRQRRNWRADRHLDGRPEGGEPGHLLAMPEPSVSDLLVLVETVQQLLDELPERYQAVVLLRLEGFSIAEIAAKVGVSERTVLRVMAHLRAMGPDDPVDEC